MYKCQHKRLPSINTSKLQYNVPIPSEMNLCMRQKVCVHTNMLCISMCYLVFCTWKKRQFHTDVCENDKQTNHRLLLFFIYQDKFLILLLELNVAIKFFPFLCCRENVIPRLGINNLLLSLYNLFSFPRILSVTYFTFSF